jgi:uncharacterized membrane protein
MDKYICKFCLLIWPMWKNDLTLNIDRWGRLLAFGVKYNCWFDWRRKFTWISNKIGKNPIQIYVRIVCWSSILPVSTKLRVRIHFHHIFPCGSLWVPYHHQIHTEVTVKIGKRAKNWSLRKKLKSTLYENIRRKACTVEL